MEPISLSLLFAFADELYMKRVTDGLETSNYVCLSVKCIQTNLQRMLMWIIIWCTHKVC